jgi:hypothetical protein
MVGNGVLSGGRDRQTELFEPMPVTGRLGRLRVPAIERNPTEGRIRRSRHVTTSGTRSDDLPLEKCSGTPNIHLCWLYGWSGCLRADRPVMAARGFARLRIVPCEHFQQEYPSGTAGRPGSSPPAPAAHCAGAVGPRLPDLASGASLSGNWRLRLCRLGC